MDIAYLIAHPEELDQETLYDLRRLVAVYPTYHAARILFLQNLFLLHDPTFDQELRRAALLVPDRRVLFAMTQTIGKPKKTATASVSKSEEASPKPTVMEVQVTEEPKGGNAAERKVEVAAEHKGEVSSERKGEALAEEAPMQDTQDTTTPAVARGRKNAKKYAVSDSTSQLLDNFLDTTPRPLAKKRIKADPSTDYMSYLMQQEEEEMRNAANTESETETSRLDNLIDSFIETAEGGITLAEDPMMPEEATDETPKEATVETPKEATVEAAVEMPKELTDEATDENETRVVTSTAELSETLAQIYIKQHRYDRAIEVLSKINTDDAAKSNPYLADQMRFLQKLSKLHSGKSK